MSKITIFILSFIVLFGCRSRTHSDIKIFNNDNEAVQTYSAHIGAVTSISIGPNNKIFASGSSDESVIIWNLDSGEILHKLIGHESTIQSVAFSPDGLQVVAVADYTIKTWDVKTGELLKTVHGGAVDRDGHQNAILSASYSPNNKFIATGSLDNSIRTWNLPDLKQGKILSLHPTNTKRAPDVTAVVVSLDSKSVVAGYDTDNSIKVWDIEPENNEAIRVVRTMQGHTGSILDLAISMDGKTIASASNDKFVGLWDYKTGSRIKFVNLHSQRVNSVTFSPDGEFIATGSGDNTAIVWNLDTSTGKTIKSHSATIHSVRFTPDGEYLLTASGDGTIKKFDLSQLK